MVLNLPKTKARARPATTEGVTEDISSQIASTINFEVHDLLELLLSTQLPLNPVSSHPQ